MIRSIRIGTSISAMIVLFSLLTACGSKETPSAISAQSSSKTNSTSTSATADLSQPEGPIQTIFQAARDKNYELYRSAFSDVVPPEALSQQRFDRFVKKVNDGTLELVSGAEKVSDTEAIVKMRNTKKKKERAYRVRKVGDRWLIVGLVGGERKGKGKQVQEEL